MELSIDLPAGGRISATLYGTGGTLLALGHGAGGSRRTPALVSFAEGLATTGRAVLLYNFPYSEAGRRFPDRAPVLESVVGDVARHARQGLGASRVVVGGRSMGGRMASQAVAAGLQADGLLFLAYPLHPPGQPTRLRDRHLEQVACPMLFVQGDRDEFARFDLLQATLRRLGPRAELHALVGGNHAFRLAKQSGRGPADVESELLAAAAGWLERHEL